MKNFLLKTWLIIACLLTGVGMSWAETYTKVSSLTAGKSYLVVYYNSSNKTYYVFDGSSPSNGASSANITFSPENDAITGDFHSYTVEISNSHTQGKYLVKSASGSYLGRSANSNGMDLTTTKPTSGTNYDNTIDYNSNGYFTLVGSGGRALGSNSGSWKYYSTANAYTHLYLYEEASSTPSYTLTFASNAQGTFSATVDGKAVTSGSKVEAGKTVTLTAEPKDGYAFNAWNVYKTANQYNYVTVAENNTFTMPSEAVTVDAYFIEGKTIPNAQLSVAAGTYRGEQSVTITNLDEDEYSYYYTLDGTTPAIDEGMNLVGTTQEYNGAINIAESCTLSILTTDLTDSRVNTFEYVIEYPYTVTIVEPENGALTVMYGETRVNSGDKFYKGDVISVTATPADGYKFRNVQFTDASAHTFTASNVKEWTMGNHDVSISATFDPIEYYTISFSINGAVQSVLYEENATIKAPAVEDINGKKFVGWVKSTVTVNPETAPSYETIGKATENVTYVAVFAESDGEGGAAETWNKVTDASTLAENDVIVIVSSEAVDYNIKGNTTKYNGYIAMGKTQNNNNRAGVAVTVADDVLTINDDVQQITLTKATFNENTDWQLGVNGGYLYANNSSNNYLKTQVTNDVNGLWNISITDGKATIYAKYSSYTRNYIRVNGNYANSVTNAPLVTAYKSDASTGVLASIYKKTGGSTYSNFTTLPVPLAEANVTISSVEYATYYNAFAYTMPANVVGKIMKKNDAGAIASEEVFTEGDVVPAETALLLKGTAATYTLVENRTPATKSVEGNLLHGLLEDGTTTGGGEGAKYYKFANGGKGLGWYYGSSDNTDGHAFSIAANKAYLVIEADEAMSSVRFISVEGFEGTITEIESVNAVDQNAEIFDLQGRRVRNTQSGVYVINGKKVIR